MATNDPTNVLWERLNDLALCGSPTHHEHLRDLIAEEGVEAVPLFDEPCDLLYLIHEHGLDAVRKAVINWVCYHEDAVTRLKVAFLLAVGAHVCENVNVEEAWAAQHDAVTDEGNDG